MNPTDLAPLLALALTTLLAIYKATTRITSDIACLTATLTAHIAECNRHHDLTNQRLHDLEQP